MVNDFSELLDKWNICASALESALKEKNFEKFQDCVKEEKNLSSRIRRIIENRSAEVAPFKPMLKSISGKWLKLSEEIELWMLETKEKIKSMQDNKAKGKKLNNLYKHLKTTGVSLKIKAK